MEALDDPITEEQLGRAEIPPEHEDQLARFLLLRAAGVPHQIVKAAQAERVSSLETWRRIAFRFDPKGLGSDLLELRPKEVTDTWLEYMALEEELCMRKIEAVVVVR